MTHNRFRWVSCQLEMLRHCFPASLCEALQELPETLDGTYECILLDIKPRNREYAYWLLQCITVAVRPLQVEELAEVLAIWFEVGKHPEYHPGWRLEDTRDAVLSACSSLICIAMWKGHELFSFRIFQYRNSWHQTGSLKQEGTSPVITFFFCPHISFSQRPASARYSD